MPSAHSLFAPAKPCVSSIALKDQLNQLRSCLSQYEGPGTCFNFSMFISGVGFWVTLGVMLWLGNNQEFFNDEAMAHDEMGHSVQTLSNNAAACMLLSALCYVTFALLFFNQFDRSEKNVKELAPADAKAHQNLMHNMLQFAEERSLAQPSFYNKIKEIVGKLQAPALLIKDARVLLDSLLDCMRQNLPHDDAFHFQYVNETSSLLAARR